MSVVIVGPVGWPPPHRVRRMYDLGCMLSPSPASLPSIDIPFRQIAAVSLYSRSTMRSEVHMVQTRVALSIAALAQAEHSRIVVSK